MAVNEESLGMSEENDELLDDTNLEDEGLDADVDDNDDYVDEDGEENDDVEEENPEEDAEDDAEENDESKDTSKQTPKPMFDKKQQAEVNKLIKARLERQDAKLVRELSNTAGVELAQTEIPQAARLWGLLKSNPQLSRDVDSLIATALSKGEAKAPDELKNSTDAIAQRLELKEAILDLKASDNTFGKNANKILAWAENEGYEITNGKSLKMAYLAWKGSQGKVAEALQKSTAKRKQDTKQMMQKRATVQSTKSGTHTGKTDYRRMSDTAFLASQGYSLFTED